MNELTGPIDPATGLPCSICNDGTIVRTDATGRDDMLEELASWSSAAASDVALVREEIVARAAGVTMLSRAGVIAAADARAMRDALLASESVDERVARAMPADAYDALTLRLRVRFDAAAALGEITNLANELAERAGIEGKVVLPQGAQRDEPLPAPYVMCAWATSLLRAGDALWTAARRADELSIGEGLGAEHRSVAAELLGLSGLSENALDVAGDRDFVLDHAWGAARVLVALARVAAEVGELLASGATLHDEAAAASAFFASLGERARLATTDAGAALEHLVRCGEDPATRTLAIETGPAVRAAVRAMRVALYHVVLDATPRDARGPSHERIAEQIGAVRAAVYDVSYRVGNVRPIEEIRRAIEAEPIE